MKTSRLLVLLVMVNIGLIAVQFLRASSVPADSVAPVVRARALELVDDAGRVRAELRVMPAHPGLKMPDGTVGYPETVLLRLLTSRNGPNVKLAATEDGSGLVLGGENGYLQLLSRSHENPFIKIVTKDGHERTFGP